MGTTGSWVLDVLIFAVTCFLLNKVGLLKPLLGFFAFFFWLMSRAFN